MHNNVDCNKSSLGEIISMNKRRKHQLERLLYTSVLFIVIILIIALIGFGYFYFFSRPAKVENAPTMPEVSAQEELMQDSLTENVVIEPLEQEEEEEVVEVEEVDPLELLREEATEIVSQMDTKEKIYQMFIVTPEALTGVDTVTAFGDASKSSLKEQPVGGLIYFSKNLVNPEQTQEMLRATNEFSYDNNGLPMFLCVDEEGGKVVRIADNAAFSVKNVGDMQDISNAEDAYQAGKTIGAYLSNLGFNFDFAPDADVLTNPKSSAIGKRSFGDNPELVATYAVAFSNGLHDNGVRSCFKHFPGHGAVEADTHDGFAYTDKNYDDLKGNELFPFEKASEYEIDAIMVAHISLPNVIGDNTPASLSQKMISDILRKDLGYQGLVITDALNMGAISQSYTSEEACVKAILAGADIILMPADFKSAVVAVEKAVESGEISETRLDESLQRIVLAKLQIRETQNVEPVTGGADGSTNKMDQVDTSNEVNEDKERDTECGSETDKSKSNESAKKVIDVSTYQGNINWSSVAKSGVSGAIIRLGYRGYGSEGSLVTDDNFAKNLEGAKSAGLQVGVYFHSEATNTAEAEEEARYVVDKLAGANLSLPIAYDLEYSSKMDKRSNSLDTQQRTDNAVAFSKVVKSSGYQAMVYYDVDAPSGKTIDTTQLKGVNIWVADYHGNENPSYNGTYQMWQYSNTGSVSGISGNVDLDYFY